MQKLLFCIVALTIFSSCKKEAPTGNVQVSISLDNLSGKTAVNRSYTINTARVYLSGFSVIDSNNVATGIKDIILINKDNTQSQNSFSFNLPPGTYRKIRFHYGLNYITNNSVDPSSFDASHPLSLSQDMFWGMLRYRFIVVEGRIDSSAAKNQVPANPFSMHLGSDTLYREITADLTSPIISGTSINIKLDLSKMFVLDQQNFDITSFSNHSAVSEIPNAILITDNLVGGIQTSIIQR
jgi:hypothetical protein